jgi:hypothetical protein
MHHTVLSKNVFPINGSSSQAENPRTAGLKEGARPWQPLNRQRGPLRRWPVKPSQALAVTSPTEANYLIDASP